MLDLCRVTRPDVMLHLAKMVGVQQKIIVPQSLRQQILKECHNVPFIGHVAMHKTLELVDRQFHW